MSRNEFPAEWDREPINSFASVRGGKRMPKGSEFAPYKTPYPYLRVIDFKDGSVDTGDLKYVLGKDEIQIRRYRITANDVYITIAGTIGLVGNIPEKLSNSLLTENAAKITGFDPLRLNKHFLAYFLRSDYAQRQIWKEIGVGGGVPKLALFRIEKINVYIPSKTEQDKIVEFLTCVDSLIDKTRAIIEKNEKIQQGMINDLFTNGLYNRSKKIVTMNKSEYRIPDNWQIKNLFRTSTLKGRIGWQGLTTNEYLNNGTCVLITGTDFQNKKINWSTCCYVSEKRYRQDINIQVQINDILITKDGTIVKIAFIERLLKKATLNSGIFVLRPIGSNYSQRFMYYVLSSKIFEKFIENLKAGSTISHLYQKDFINFEFPLPATIDEQERIANILSVVNCKIESEANYLKKLLNIRAGFMHDLLTGKVRVKVAA